MGSIGETTYKGSKGSYKVVLVKRMSFANIFPIQCLHKDNSRKSNRDPEDGFRILECLRSWMFRRRSKIFMMSCVLVK